MTDQAASPSVYRAPPPPTVACEACDARVPLEQAVRDAGGRTICRTCRTLDELGRGRPMGALGGVAAGPSYAPPTTAPAAPRSGPSPWAVLRIVAIVVIVILKLALIASR